MTAEQRETKRLLDDFFRDCRKDHNTAALLEEIEERLDSDPYAIRVKHSEKIRHKNKAKSRQIA